MHFALEGGGKVLSLRVFCKKNGRRVGVCSSIGRAAVSKAAGWGFETLRTRKEDM